MSPPELALCDLLLAPLSPASGETLRRVRVFLYIVKQPEWLTTVLLAGYTPEIHQDGVYRTSLLSGERTFAEWREWRALRPPRDPDLPELVEQLDSFATLWQHRAIDAATARIDDDGDRDEVLGYLEGYRNYSSKTWRAKAIVSRLSDLASNPTTFYRAVGEELKAQGFERTLPEFERPLATVQAWIRGADIEEDELHEIEQMREDSAAAVREWLGERRAQLAHLEARELTLLALGDRVPPPGFEPPIALLAGLTAAAKA